jgi:hypothetical protein
VSHDLLDPFDLLELQLDGRRASEDRDRDLDPAAVGQRLARQARGNVAAGKINLKDGQSSSALPRLTDRQPIRFRAVADGFLAAGKGLGDGAHAHALAGELVGLSLTLKLSLALI